MVQTETPVSKKAFWTGWGLSGFVVLFLLFDGVTHVMKLPQVTEAFAHLGVPVTLAVGLGIVELVCLALYVIPRTAILGAILLTGYLGGAVAANLRVGSPFFSTILFPVYAGLLVWGGLYLRDTALRGLIPVRKYQ